MRNFQQKKRWRSVLESWPVLVFLCLLLLIFAWGVVGLLQRMRLTMENREIAELKIKELERKKEIFTADVAKLNSETGIEESIREKFPVVKEGEGLIIVVEDKNKPEEESVEEKGFFGKLLFWRD